MKDLVLNASGKARIGALACQAFVERTEQIRLHGQLSPRGMLGNDRLDEAECIRLGKGPRDFFSAALPELGDGGGAIQPSLWRRSRNMLASYSHLGVELQDGYDSRIQDRSRLYLDGFLILVRLLPFKVNLLF